MKDAAKAWNTYNETNKKNEDAWFAAYANYV